MCHYLNNVKTLQTGSEILFLNYSKFVYEYPLLCVNIQYTILFLMLGYLDLSLFTSSILALIRLICSSSNFL